MDSHSKAIESTTRYLTTAASIAASAMLARTIVNEYLPNEVRNFVTSGVDKLFSRFSNDHAIVIKETEGLTSNELYDACSNFLRTRITPSMRRLRASKNEHQNSITLSLDEGEELIDIFQGVEYKWQLISQQDNHGSAREELSIPSEVRWFELSFHKKYKDITLNLYLPHILERAKDIKASDRKLKLHMNEYECWSPINLQHPATFETLAMEAELKNTIMEDLSRFVKRKDYYKKIGKAWKRGYLLFGPPGTGKSSLIAAMANYLRFDIYDLDLKEVRMNSGLKRLLIGMANKSLLVIEDIDCSIDLKNRDEEKEGGKGFDDEVTLSGLLNFIDGLWSTSGEERIIVFTTNYKDRLDPALLRPGRMDMHIHMGYCGASSFRVLASNYHAIDDHPLFEEIEGLMKEVEVTPAEVAEQLMRSDDADIALAGLIQLLQNKRNQVQAAKANEEVAKYSEQMDGEKKQEEPECRVNGSEGEEVIIVGDTDS